MGTISLTGLHLLAQIDLSDAMSDVGGARFFTGFTMLVHMFWAELFCGVRAGGPGAPSLGRTHRQPPHGPSGALAARFNVLTFSTGATFAVLFLVLLVGLYPQVTTSLFTNFFYFIAIAMASMGLALWGMYTYYYKWDRYSVLYKGRHILFGFTMGFFIWVWMVIMTGIDTYMTTGGGSDTLEITQGNVANFGVALQGIFNPMFVEMILHRTFANLSWPAFALAAYASFMYIRSKTQEDRAFYRLDHLGRANLGRRVLDAPAAHRFRDDVRSQDFPARQPGEPGGGRWSVRAAYRGGKLEPVGDQLVDGGRVVRVLERRYVPGCGSAF